MERKDTVPSENGKGCCPGGAGGSGRSKTKKSKKIIIVEPIKAAGKSKGVSCATVKKSAKKDFLSSLPPPSAKEAAAPAGGRESTVLKQDLSKQGEKAAGTEDGGDDDFEDIDFFGAGCAKSISNYHLRANLPQVKVPKREIAEYSATHPPEKVIAEDPHSLPRKYARSEQEYLREAPESAANTRCLLDYSAEADNSSYDIPDQAVSPSITFNSRFSVITRESYINAHPPTYSCIVSRRDAPSRKPFLAVSPSKTRFK